MGREGPVQVNGHYPDFFALFLQGKCGFFNRLSARAHHNNDIFRIRSTSIIEKVVTAANQPGELVHGPLYDFRAAVVERVDGFTRLEVNVGVHGGAAQYGIIGCKGAGAVCADQFGVDHGVHVVFSKVFHFGDLMRGAETIKEVQERHAAFQGCCLRNQSHVMGFLRRA